MLTLLILLPLLLSLLVLLTRLLLALLLLTLLLLFGAANLLQLAGVLRVQYRLVIDPAALADSH